MIRFISWAPVVSAETEESPVGMLGRQEVFLTAELNLSTVARTNKDWPATGVVEARMMVMS